MVKAIVSGAAGFIGSNLVDRLVSEGHKVIGIDDMSNGHMEFLESALSHKDSFDLWKGDFASKEVLDAISSLPDQFKPDIVFHLAAVPRVSYSVEHPLETHETNVNKTLKLMDACRGKIRRFVFASSSSVYGGADVLPTPESHPRGPKSPYALQKAHVEDYLKLYYELYGLDSACLRFFNVFGPRALGDSPYSTAVSAWLTAIKSGKPMRSDGDGTQSRDMCYVDNVVHALILAAKAEGHLGAECFNVACGDTIQNNEILSYLMQRYPDAQVVNAPWRAGDVMRTQASIEKGKAFLSYEPRVMFWEGLQKTIDWYEASWDKVKDMKLNK